MRKFLQKWVQEIVLLDFSLPHASFPLRAQCYPRLACALHVSLFMQLPGWPQAASVLVRLGMKNAFSYMQNHAPYACTRNLRLASQEKSCFGRLPRDAVESDGAEYA
ncbi:TPA: hypothetical protein ACH2JW_002138 [Serratia marcescens]|nr:hypothetical protein [Serratia marcescens]